MGCYLFLSTFLSKHMLQVLGSPLMATRWLASRSERAQRHPQLLLRRHCQAAPYRRRLYQMHDYKSKFTFYGHSGPIYSLAIDDSGAFIASGGEDKKIIIWNACTKTIAHTIACHCPIMSLVWLKLGSREILLAGTFCGQVVPIYPDNLQVREVKLRRNAS